MLTDGGDVDRSVKPQGPTERPASLRKIEAALDGVQVRTATGQTPTGIRNQAAARWIRIDIGRHDS